MKTQRQRLERSARAAAKTDRPIGWLLVSLLVGAAQTLASAESANTEPASNENPFASMLNSAVINGKVNLPCDISPANADDSVALILWYKDDSLAPIYTIDARKVNSLDKAKTTLDESYANRAAFNLRAKPAHLQLEQVRPDDEGDYRCRVDFKRGRTVNTIISLRVIVPPEEISIATLQQPGQRLAGLIGPFNEGSELALVCLATGGKPRPQITWRRDFNVLDDTSQHVDKEGTRVVLKIPSLNKNHLLSIFTCQASNNNITSPLQSSITLDLNLKPQEVVLKQLQPHEPLIVGQNATFECLTHGSRPQASVHWLFQGTRHDPPVNADQQQTSSRLRLNLQRSFNQQLLSCVAENDKIQASTMRQTVKLDVHYPPSLSIKLEQPTSGGGDSPAAQLQEGIDIYLTCHMDANPRPLKPILWRFNGRPLQSGGGGGAPSIVMNNQSLVLRKATRQQSGSYTCEATNQHGSSVSKPMELQIRHAPVCASDDVLVYEAAVGQTVALDCDVHASPSRSVHFSWFSAPGEQSLADWVQRDAGMDEQVDESGPRLKFKVRDEASYGLVKCKAKNEIGLQQRPCLFQIIQAPVPTMRHNCQLLNASTNSLQLSCKPNEHLKSEDFELTSKRQQADSEQSSQQPVGMRSWLNLEAMRQQSQQIASSGQHEPTAIPNLRLVYPPNWLMGELYKQQPQDAQNSDQSDQNYQLVAYIIVGSAHQLASVKSIVEDNGLFSSNPKSVYYVIAKQSNETAGSSTAIKLPSEGLYPFAKPRLSSSYDSITAANQSLRDLLIEDPSVKLADSFMFTVPKLEPRTRYKLFIYGQNLANRTRDWLVVKGETLHDDPVLSSRSQMMTDLSRMKFMESHQLGDVSQEAASKSAPNQQKSVVMRSDQDNTGENQVDVAPNNEPNSIDRAKVSTEESAPYSDSVLSEKLQQMNQFKEYAIYYARQKPLLAVPAIVTSLIALTLLSIWLAGFLVQLIRPNRRGNRRDRRGSSADSGKSKAKEHTLNAYRDIGELNRKSSLNTIGPNTDANNNNPKLNGGDQYVISSPSSQSYETNSSSHPDRHSKHSDGHLLIDTDHTSIPLVAQNGQIYTIETSQDAYVSMMKPVTIGAQSVNYQAALGGVYNQDSAGQFWGSLDRKMTSNQPIYLTESNGSFIQLHESKRPPQLQFADSHHQTVGSIDRRLVAASHTHIHNHAHPFRPASSSGHQEQMVLAGLSELEPAIYLPHGARIRDPNHYCTNESFSSTECSSEMTHQSSATSTTHIGKPRQQRVAFDLSNQRPKPIARPRQTANNPVYGGHLRAANGQQPNAAAPVPTTHLDVDDLAPSSHHQKQQSESGGGSSNTSGMTADSGLESPPTAETNSATTGGQVNGLVAMPACRSPGVDVNTIYGGGNGANGPGNNLVMLMELSPGSQESGTLLHSVDSYAELAPQAAADHNYLLLHQHHLHNNHQMATSFTSATALANADEGAELKDVDRWL